MRSKTPQTSLLVYVAGGLSIWVVGAGCGNEGKRTPLEPSGAAGQTVAGAAGGSRSGNAGMSSSGAAGNGSGSGGVASGSIGGSRGSSGTGGSTGVNPDASPRSRQLINDGWRFTKGDPQGTTGLAYAAAKAWVLPSGQRVLERCQ